MLSIALSFLVVGSSAFWPAGPLRDASTVTFEQYVSHFNKTYSRRSEEWATRKALFTKRLEEVVAHNSGLSSYTKAVNVFSDMTDAELKRMLGYKHIPADRLAALAAPGTHTVFQVENITAPTNIDWRGKNVLSPIKNQMQCGGCWSFAATEAIESSAAISSRTRPVELAMEQILRCTPNPNDCGGTGGCNGATAELAYAYLSTVSGQTLESKYPYVSGGGNTGECTWSQSAEPAAVKVTGYTTNPPNSRAATIQMLNRGPVSINVEATSWFSYSGGVFDGCNKEATLTIDHVVQLVGMKTDSSGAVSWIVRNSWGPSWGEEGFIYLADTDACVTDPQPGEGTGCTGGPATVSVCGPCGMFYVVSWPNAAPISA